MVFYLSRDYTCYLLFIYTLSTFLESFLLPDLTEIDNPLTPLLRFIFRNEPSSLPRFASRASRCTLVLFESPTLGPLAIGSLLIGRAVSTPGRIRQGSEAAD